MLLKNTSGWIGEAPKQVGLPLGSEIQMESIRQQNGSSSLPQTDSPGQQTPSMHWSTTASQAPASSHWGRFVRQTPKSHGTSSSQQVFPQCRSGRQQTSP